MKVLRFVAEAALESAAGLVSGGIAFLLFWMFAPTAPEWARVLAFIVVWDRAAATQREAHRRIEREASALAAQQEGR